MDEIELRKRLSKYNRNSKYLYDFLLWGSKHFGYYPEDSNISEKKAQLLMQDLVGERLQLSSSKRVLDAGCGQGVASVYLAKKFNCFIRGISILSFEVIKAQNHARKLGVKNIVDYSLMDYSNMGFLNDSFDAIYTLESLSHSTNILRTLGEFHRVLRKGGRIALFEYTLAEDSLFSSYEMDMVNKVMYASAMDGLKQFRHDKFHYLLEEANFKDVTVKNITGNVMPSLKRLRKFFFVPYLFVKVGQLQKYSPNLTSGNEFYNMAQKDLIRYNIFTAEK